MKILSLEVLRGGVQTSLNQQYFECLSIMVSQCSDLSIHCGCHLLFTQCVSHTSVLVTLPVTNSNKNNNYNNV